MRAMSPIARNRIRHLLVAATLAVVVQGAAAPTFAADEQPFVEKKYRIDGGWSLVEEGGQTLVRFDDGFATEGGPDLKVFLSPTTIDAADGDNATEGSLLLGELESTSGTQDYLVPEGVTLEDFASVLVHCEEFSVLWGGGDLRDAASAP